MAGTAHAVQWTPDGTHLVVGGAEGVLQRIHRQRWQSVGQAAAPSGDSGAGIESFLLDSQGRPLVAGQRDGQLRFYDGGLSGSFRLAPTSPSRAWRMAPLSEEGSFLVALQSFGLYAGTTADGGSVRPILAEWRVAGVATTSARPYFATTQTDGSICLWDAASLELVRELRAPRSELEVREDWPRRWNNRTRYGQPLISSARTGQPSHQDGSTALLASGSSTLSSAYRGGQVLELAFSPDGRLLAAGTGQGAIELYEVESGALLRELSDHRGRVEALAFSSDGRLLASGSHDSTVALWSVDEARVLRRYHAHMGPVLDVAFSPDDLELASVGDDGCLRVWGTELETPRPQLRSHSAFVQAARFSPDLTQLLSSGRDDSTLIDTYQETPPGSANKAWWESFTWVWDLETGERLQRVGPHAESACSLGWWTDGSLWASDDSGTVHVWSASRSASHFDHATSIDDQLPRYGQTHGLVAISPDQRYVARDCNDSGIQVVRRSDGQVWAERELGVRTWEHPELGPQSMRNEVRSLAFTPDGNTIASGHSDGGVRLWDTETLEPLGELRGATTWATALDIDPSGRTLAVGHDDGRIELWDLEAQSLLDGFQAHAWGVVSLRFHESKSELASVDRRGHLNRW